MSDAHDPTTHCDSDLIDAARLEVEPPDATQAAPVGAFQGVAAG